MPLTSEQAQALTKRRDAGETLTPQEARSSWRHTDPKRVGR
jgi:hypothetical protein